MNNIKIFPLLILICVIVLTSGCVGIVFTEGNQYTPNEQIKIHILGCTADFLLAFIFLTILHKIDKINHEAGIADWESDGGWIAALILFLVFLTGAFLEIVSIIMLTANLLNWHLPKFSSIQILILIVSILGGILVFLEYRFRK